ncbi:MAG: EamA family transporter [Bacteroidales bacterium]|nr:EamA family transporter [Bacteroidales bacterium]
MIPLLISIITASAILFIFKFATRYKTSNLHLVTLSYFFSACLGILFAVFRDGASINFTTYNWFIPSIFYGIFFILGFLLFGISSQRSGIAATSISSRISVIIPVLFGFFMFHDELSISRLCGIAFAIFALVLITLPDKRLRGTAITKEKQPLWIMLLPVFIFFIIGINDTLIKIAQFYLIRGNDYAEFIASCYTFSFIVGAIIMLIKKEIKVSGASILFGLLLGVLNFFNFRALIIGMQQMPVTQFIPIYNIGVVIISSCIGIIFFKEKLSKFNIAGIVTAIIAIILLTIL